MKRKLMMQITVIVLISFIPAFYAFIFLYAYWDPASHLSDISVAVVNNDKGAVIAGENVNIGNSLVDKLKSNSDVKWAFTDKKDADNGVLNEIYYAELVIPDDFSECISTAAEVNKSQGTLYFKSNDKLGTFASSTMSSVSANIENAVSKSITESLVDSLAGMLQELPDSLQKFSDGLSKLDDGAEQINHGINQLRTGIGQMKASVDSSIQQLKNSSFALEGYGKFAASPVKMETTKIGEAKNTGMAMAPFMISLCLWLGGLMFVIIFTTMDKVKFDELKWAQRTMIDFGQFRYQLLAAIQAVCLGFTVINILGLQVGDAVQFYGICILGGMTFVTIIQVLVLVFQDLGKLLSIIFMLLQLTAGGGMLSMALVPSFYKAIHPYMPMTYTINALRDNILSMDTGDYSQSMWVLAITLILGLLLTAFMSLLTRMIRRRKEKLATTAIFQSE